MNLLPLAGLRLRLRLGDVLVEWIMHNVEPLNQCIFFGCSLMVQTPWCLVPDLVDGLVNQKVEENEKEKVRSSHFVSTELLWVSLNLSATLWFYSSVSNFTTFSVVLLLSPDADTESVITDSRRLRRLFVHPSPPVHRLCSFYCSKQVTAAK